MWTAYTSVSRERAIKKKKKKKESKEFGSDHAYTTPVGKMRDGEVSSTVRTRALCLLSRATGSLLGMRSNCPDERQEQSYVLISNVSIGQCSALSVSTLKYVFNNVTRVLHFVMDMSRFHMCLLAPRVRAGIEDTAKSASY